MSKQIKQMQINALKETFQGVRDMVVLNVTGLTCQADNHLRHTMRQKNIRLQMVKNSLARHVLSDLGMSIPQDSPFWAGNTLLAWGASSLGELSRGLDEEIKNPKTASQYKDKVKFKGALVEGQPISFEQALKMPTRAEAIARVLTLALSPASRLVSQITGPAAQLRGQLKSLEDKKPDETVAAAAAAAAAG